MDWAKREPGGRRREAIGDARVAGEARGVDVDSEGLAGVEARGAEREAWDEDP